MQVVQSGVVDVVMVEQSESCELQDGWEEGESGERVPKVEDEGSAGLLSVAEVVLAVSNDVVGREEEGAIVNVESYSARRELPPSTIMRHTFSKIMWVYRMMTCCPVRASTHRAIVHC